MSAESKPCFIKPKYDVIIVGASLLCCFEAFYQSKSGNKVLMIDTSDGIGGAWRPLKIFGLSEVENAIHYFLPSEAAIEFLTETLGLDIEKSQKKVQVFKLKNFGYLKLRFDSSVTRFFARLFLSKNEMQKSSFPRVFLTAVTSLFEKQRASFYLKSGASAMLRVTQSLLQNSDIKTTFNTHISAIRTNSTKDGIEVLTDKGTFNTSRLLVTHGTKIDNYFSCGKRISITEKCHPRPACHMLVQDPSPPKSHEAIFLGSEKIKYVHDVSRFLRGAGSMLATQKIFVFALHPNVTNTKRMRLELFEELRDAKLIGDGATLLKFRWSNTFLPVLDDEDLKKLERSFLGFLETMRTENFTKCVEDNALKWKTVFHVKD